MKPYDWPGPLTWQQRERINGLKRKPLVCPKCGNDKPEDMRLSIADIEWCTYYFDEMDELNGKPIPLYSYANSVHTESSDRHQPAMTCYAAGENGTGYCYMDWEVSWSDFDLG